MRVDADDFWVIVMGLAAVGFFIVCAVIALAAVAP